MACRKCGSSWTTLGGKDMASCPGCCKQQRCKARKQGRLPASQANECRRCGNEFRALAADASRLRYCENCRGIARKEYLRAMRQRLTPERSRRARMCRSLAGVLRDIRSSMSSHLGACKSFNVETKRQPGLCCTCSKPFTPDPRRDQRFCSLSCCHVFEERPRCITCGIEFSLRCVGRDAKKKRLRPECKSCVRSRWRNSPAGKEFRKKKEHRTRCRKHGVRYDSSVKPRAVFERDGYRCHICKKKTLSKYVVSGGRAHPRSPTVDHHPYPLSAGVKGHEWDNVRCACLRCNVRKGAAWSGQKLLFS
jgi:hypothetical protein